MNNLCKTPENCCGCGLCAIICPQSIIKMKADKEGFLYPEILETEKCIHCSKCENHCPELNRIVPPRSCLSYFSGYAKDDELIKDTASGGIATVISESFINNGGIVYGVIYSTDFRSIIYSRATTIPELKKFRGSKYAQSFKSETFKFILSDLNKGKSVLFFGLPCDIASLNNYTKNKYNNLYTIGLICHGVTSPLIHREFIDNLLSPNYSLSNFSVRYKKNAWKPYFIRASFNNNFQIIKPFRSSEYGISFQYFKRPCCYSCRFKIFDNEYGLQSDITIGDNHGVRKKSPSYNHWGSSSIVVHTNKGINLLDSVKNSFVLNKESESIVFENRALIKPACRKTEREKFVNVLLKKGLKNTRWIWSIMYKDYLMKMRKQIAKIHIALLDMQNQILK